MTDYTVNYTEIGIPPITVPGTEVNATALDVTLFGRINPEYGEALNENLLNILENFACPESGDTVSFQTATPDLDATSKTQLHNPTTGQFWFNSTRKFIYFFDGTNWVPLPSRGNYAANWGQIMDGQQLPRPYNAALDYTFEYSECIWSVSPTEVSSIPGSLSCATFPDSTVRMQYRLTGSSTLQSGLANYLIIGIRGNVNDGSYIPPMDVSPTPTPTAMASPTPAPSNTPAPSVTPTPGISSTPSPTPTRTRSPTPVPSVTPTLTRTPTPAPSNTPGPSNTPAPSSTPPPSVTPTRTRTPTPAPSVTPSSTKPANPCAGGQGCDPTNANGNCGCPPGWNPVFGGCQRATSPFDFQDCP